MSKVDESEVDEFLNKCTHAFVAISTAQLGTDNPFKTLLHIVAYQGEPDELIKEELYNELAIDEKLGMTHLVPRKDYLLLLVPWSSLQKII